MTDSTIPTTPEPDGEEDESSRPIMQVLVTLGIVDVTYVLEGSGDSGECQLESVRYADGREAAELPAIPIGFRDDGEIIFLDVALENIAADLPEGDWVNNEGGYGTVSFFPFEPCSEDRIVCDMTFRVEDDYEDEDDDDFDELDPPEDQTLENGEIVLVASDLSFEGAIQ